MKNGRRTQPYRGGKGPAGPSLSAMLLGRSPLMPNPMDASRKATKQLNRKKRVRKRRQPSRRI